jgi:hypothetical protein
VALRRAAGAKLAAAGQPDEAFQLFAQAGAWDEASRLLRTLAPVLLQQGRTETVIRWVLAVPEDVRGADPWLQLWLGVARSPTDPRGARPALDCALQRFERDGEAAGAYLAWAALTEGFFFEMDDLHPLDGWLAALERLRARFPSIPAPEVEARVVGAAFGAFMNRKPESQDLRAWEERALSLALSPGDAGLRLALGRTLAVYYGWWAMDLAKGRVVLDTLHPLATDEKANPPMPSSGRSPTPTSTCTWGASTPASPPPIAAWRSPPRAGSISGTGFSWCCAAGRRSGPATWPRRPGRWRSCACRARVPRA